MLPQISKVVLGTILFVSLYRVAFFSSQFMPVIILGLTGFLILLQKDNLKIITENKRFRNFLSTCFVLLIYVLYLDLNYIKTGNLYTINNLFSIRLTSLMLLTILGSYCFQFLVSSNNTVNMIFCLKYAIFLQLLFFVVMYLQPSLKIPFYNFFGMQDSPNLFDHNFSERGFGVGSELNFTGPVTTAIIALLVINSNILKSIMFISQIANSSIAFISIIFFFKNKKLLALYLILFPVAFWLLFVKYYDIGIASYLPRFAREVDSGFTITYNALINNHYIYQGRDFYDFMFGSDINLLPIAGSHLLSSDIGWIIMLNYGGIFLIFIYLLFIISILRLSPFENHVKIMLFMVILALNTKGLFFGPNALLFFIFLMIFDSIRTRNVVTMVPPIWKQAGYMGSVSFGRA